MFFLRQIHEQFFLQCVSYQEAPEAGPRVEEEGPPENEALQDPRAELEGLAGEAEAAGRRAEGEQRGIDADIANLRALENEEGTVTLTPDDITLRPVPRPQEIEEGTEREQILNEFSPEQQALLNEHMDLLEQVRIGEIEHTDPRIQAFLDNPEIQQLFAGYNLSDFLNTALIDSDPDAVIEEATPEELTGALTEIDGAVRDIEERITETRSDDPRRPALEGQRRILQGMQAAVGRQLDPANSPEIIGGGDVMNIAQRHLGLNEHRDRQTDRFLMGLARDSRETPWCAGFVSYVLHEAGFTNRAPTLSSRAFIGESGLGHVAFYAGNNMMLGGNQSDSVSIAPINREIRGWIMPEDYNNSGEVQRGGTPPVGAIVVFARGGGDRNVA